MLSIIISLLCAHWLMLVIYILFLYLPTIKTRYLHKYFISTPSLEPLTRKKQFHLSRNLWTSNSLRTKKISLGNGLYQWTDFWLFQRRDATPPRQQGRAWPRHPAPASHLGPGLRSEVTSLQWQAQSIQHSTDNRERSSSLAITTIYILHSP